MADFTGKDRIKAKEDALRRSLGMDPRKKQPQKGSHKRKMQLGIRRTSMESRQEATS